MDLIPVKGDNKRKHAKRKHPKECISRNAVQSTDPITEVNEISSESEEDEENIPVLSIANDAEDNNEIVDLTGVKNGRNEVTSGPELFIDLTEDKNMLQETVFENMEEDDVIIAKGQDCYISKVPSVLEQFTNAELHDNIPDAVFWESVLAALERCEHNIEFEEVAAQLKLKLPPLRQRKANVHFNPELHYIDATATACLPSDAPQNVHAIWTLGDGNCLGRSVSTGYTGSDQMHLELRARTVIEGAVNKRYYLADEYLNQRVFPGPSRRKYSIHICYLLRSLHEQAKKLQRTP